MIEIPYIKLKILIGDAQLHFCASFVISAILYLVLHNIRTAFFLTTIIGVAKQLYDNYVKKTYFDMSDFASDVVGAIAGIMAVALCI